MTYRPLDDRLTIGKSVIHGQGLIAVADIEANTCLGVTHVVLDTRLIRTPLGGFINHSPEQANCMLKVGTLGVLGPEEQYKIEDTSLTPDYECKYLWTSRKINAGEELTLTYQMYDPT